MRITFKSVHLHHFLSFDDGEIILSKRGYCLVEGVNKNKTDAATSNGSGKSSLWSAICWALTGETIQGLHSNIANIAFNDGCWVELCFTVDAQEYKIVRSKEDVKAGTDLKIFINGEDKSGKGIRESEAILNQYLPELTPDLIGSVIILGQGLPHKFADNSPSGRKEILEKLSKSDFMIDDLKSRAVKRSNDLAEVLRQEEDVKLSTEVQIEGAQKSLSQHEQESLQYQIEPNYDELILNCKEQLAVLSANITEITAKQQSVKTSRESLNKTYQGQLTEKLSKSKKIMEEHAGIVRAFDQQTSAITNDIHILEDDIYRLKSIKDVCPTCGQKIPGVLKPDTRPQEIKLAERNKQLTELQKIISDDAAEYADATKRLEASYADKEKELKAGIADILKEEDRLHNKLYDAMKDKSEIELQKASEENDQRTFQANKLRIQQAITDTKSSIDSLQKAKTAIEAKLTVTQNHIAVVSKMITLIKRDFRGFLLTNIIDFIDKRAKYYCQKIFNTSDLQFKLVGNNINIQFCNKDYENLSGGEAQKINIILMLSIKDMMSTCLNFNSNILVLDEITDNLDMAGCEKIINLISTEVSGVESLFIISHRADELAIPYDEKIVVEKNDKGVSRIL